MRFVLDAVYLFALLILSPWLVYKAITTGKYRRGLLSKLTGHVAPLGFSRQPSALSRVWFHGVSVGEIHLLRQVVTRFRLRHPECQVVISTTTDTGFAEARQHFAALPVVYWPFDFSWAVRRALQTLKPSLIVLAEGEIWPNFLLAAKQQGIPVAVVNGRMSPRSTRTYRRFRPFVRRFLRCIDVFAAQTDAYAANYRELGVEPERVLVTGSVKYDGVEGNRDNLKTRDLRRLLAVERDDLIWIAGSTQAPEEQIVLDIYWRLLDPFPNLRLVLVPRQKERFKEVANLLERAGQPFLRRSELSEPIRDRDAVVLVDTIGELGALWGFADVAYVGGSLDGKRGGQNMIEPAAYGAAVVFGPHVWNFRDTAERLVEQKAAVQISDPATLEEAVRQLLGNAAERQRMGQTARSFVLRQQGATERTLAILHKYLNARETKLAS
ncbi:MAG: 3-deoxy-D-manno-octulosonic acid transferase [Gemmataceae bacterium]